MVFDSQTVMVVGIYKTLIYLAGSASAEVIADVALCHFEAVKVHVQTQLGFSKGMSNGLPKFVISEGTMGLYKGSVPLWGRQIPYTMMKFASFETIVELIYKHAIPKPKNECSKEPLKSVAEKVYEDYRLSSYFAAARLDLNTREDNEAATSCKQLDS